MGAVPHAARVRAAMSDKPDDARSATTTFIPASTAAKHFPGHTERYVRETMTQLGFATKIGRRYYTTASDIEAFVNHVKEHGLCRRGGRSASRASVPLGARPRGRVSVCAEDDLREALALLEKMKAPAKAKRRAG